jgi:hypothetical protein
VGDTAKVSITSLPPVSTWRADPSGEAARSMGPGSVAVDPMAEGTPPGLTVYPVMVVLPVSP